jgi:hypothetical protein
MKTLEVGEGGQDVKVVNNVAEVSGDDDGGDGITKGADGVVGRLESSLDLGLEVEDEDRLVNLNALGTSSLEGLKELNVDRHKLVDEGDGVDRRTSVGLAEGKERNGANENGASLEASFLCLEELPHRLGVLCKGEGLVVLESGLDIVVVGVKPFDHL